ncbi:MAG: TrbC/VirB2 family protein [Campylobacteraceae bacterium]|jgi:type IV secretion system protein VirB2|nr:TrbC/VirB2 family protein [Campylobacteraceae bacterium]
MANANTSPSGGQFTVLTKVFVAVLFCGFLLPDFALAQMELNTVQGTLENILTALRALSMVTVTIAILYVGYKVLFGGATFKELMPVIIGAIVIASCAEIAGLLLRS